MNVLLLPFTLRFLPYTASIVFTLLFGWLVWDDRELWPALKKFFAKDDVEAAVR